MIAPARMMHLLEKIATARIAVLGDLIVDTYLEGDVRRISPEAPVPVLHWSSERSVLGGAANVAANIASLDATVRLVGLAGDDAGGADLALLLGKYAQIDASGVVYERGGVTSVKTRLVSGRQQLVRIDREQTALPQPAVEHSLVEYACAAVDWCDVLIVSDYGKGTLSDAVLGRVLDRACALGKRAIVDPKRTDFSAYRGAWLITPNRGELSAATGLACDSDEQVERAARKVHHAYGCDVLVTRSEKGLSYVPQAGTVIHMPTAAQEVFDVSGAGDTVVAALGVAVAADADVGEAMVLANRAAGIVVGKSGTAMVTPQELLKVYEGPDGDHRGESQLFDIDALVHIRALWRRLGLRVGFANGCFDLVHPGHVSLIRQAARECDRLIVALNSDASVRRLKGPTRPIQNAVARAEVIGAIKGVDAVVTFQEDTPYELIGLLEPDVLVKGADYREDQVVGGDLVKARGGRIVLAALSEGHSTSLLLKRH